MRNFHLINCNIANVRPSKLKAMWGLRTDRNELLELLCHAKLDSEIDIVGLIQITLDLDFSLVLDFYNNLTKHEQSFQSISNKSIDCLRQIELEKPASKS